jgi:hypothetical protein
MSGLIGVSLIFLMKSFFRDTSPVLQKRSRDFAKKKRVIRRAWTATDVRDLKTLAKKKKALRRLLKR